MARHIDALGTAHPAADAAARIVCLVPSLTELLCDLGCAGRIVGRTRFCVHPRDLVRGIPIVGGTKDVDLEKVARLEPTHAVVNVDENRRDTAEALARLVSQVIVTHPKAPEDNPSLYRLLGGIFGCAERAEALCGEFERAYAAARHGAAAGAERVLYLIWRDPWMTVSRDTYISRTLALFGWHTEPGRAGDRYPRIELPAFRGLVDRVLLSSEPFPFQDRHLAEVREQVAPAEVAIIDGEMASWYGSRAVRGLAYLSGYTREARERSGRPPGIESPCVGVCVLDPESGCCRGCSRTLDEIARWTSYPLAERRRIMAELPARRTAGAREPRGGQATTR